MYNRRQASKIMALGTGSLLFNPSGFLSNTKKMNVRLIPSSTESLPVVGLGTWQTFDVGTSVHDRGPLKEVLEILVNHGGSMIDSSPMYGRSESVVGDLTSELKIKSKIFQATKVWTTGQQAGIQQMHNSFKYFQVGQMDLMQIHNLVDWQIHLKTLQSWKEEGKIRYIGITHYLDSAYQEMEKIMQTQSIDFIQINYNLAATEAAKRILPLAQEKNIGVIINRPYQGGALFRKVRGVVLPDWAADFEANTWGQFFLKYNLSHPAVNCVIPGTSKAKHMLDNVQAGYGTYPTIQQQKKMKKFFDQL